MPAAQQPDALRLAVDQGTEPELRWVALASDASGFGDEARGFLRTLAPRMPGLRLSNWQGTAPTEMNGGDRALLEDLSRRPGGGQPPIGVTHLPSAGAFTRLRGCSYHVARAMFEADRIPAAWVAAANLMDEIWVPSQFNRRTFRASGVTSRIEVVPGGVDVAAFHPSAPPADLGTRGGIRFLSIFEWRRRKAPELLLRAWSQAFGPGDDVELVVRTTPAGPFDEIVRAVTGRRREELAPIRLLEGRYADAEMAGLYTAADVVVLPTRGESWSRTACEAMACGRPVVTTRWSGHLDFMDDTNSLLVDVEELRPVDAVDLPYDGLRWAQPSLPSLVACLQAATDADRRQVLGVAARQAMLGWTWDRAADVVTARTEEIWGRLARRRHRPPPGAPRVLWQGDHFRYTSLATVNRVTGLGLLERGWDLHVESREVPELRPHASDALRPLVEATRPVEPGGVDVEVHFEWPPHLARSASGDHPLVIFQPWEFGAVPVEWVARSKDTVTEYWVPTSWVRDCFVASGVAADRVVVMPHGADTSLWRPDGPRLPLRTDASFRFLYVGGLVWRKGVDLLLQAYLEAFTAADDVCLVVKSSTFYAGEIPDRVREAIRVAGDQGLAHIELIEEDLSPEAMAALFRSCDALVHPYRGEGFALPVLEAMATGVPVAVTGYGACLDYCNAANALLLPAAFQTLPPEVVGGIPLAGTPFCAEPDLAGLRKSLQTLYVDRAGNAARAATARRDVLAGWTLGHSIDTVDARLRALVGRGPAQPRRAAAGLEAPPAALVEA